MNNFHFIQSYLNLALYLSICFKGSFQIKCKDEGKKNVDWFINYKLPKITKEKKGSDLFEGTAYAYLTSENPGNWTLSSQSIQFPNSPMLLRTWQEFKEAEKKKKVAYIFYNDEPPSHKSAKSVGHMKGIVAFDEHFGIWLIHTMPKFGLLKDYEYPLTSTVNGQTIFCVTFETSMLNKICHHLLYCHPNIYERYADPAIEEQLDKEAKSIFSKKPAFVFKKPFQKETSLRSADGETFSAFAKDNQLKIDIYSSLIAPKLDTSLIVSSWRRGVGTFLKPFCKSNYSVVDIISIKMNFVTKKGKKEVSFKSTEDHSKWAISSGKSKSWVCLGDLNRMKSQENRGGGALCLNSKPVWKAFNSIISDVSQCPVGISVGNSSTSNYNFTFYTTLCVAFLQFVLYFEMF